MQQQLQLLLLRSMYTMRGSAMHGKDGGWQYVAMLICMGAHARYAVDNLMHFAVRARSCIVAVNDVVCGVLLGQQYPLHTLCMYNSDRGAVAKPQLLLSSIRLPDFGKSRLPPLPNRQIYGRAPCSMGRLRRLVAWGRNCFMTSSGAVQLVLLCWLIAAKADAAAQLVVRQSAGCVTHRLTQMFCLVQHVSMRHGQVGLAAALFS